MSDKGVCRTARATPGLLTISTDKKQTFEKKGKAKEKNIRTKGTDFIRWRIGLIRTRIKPVRRRIKPVRRRIKPVHLVLIFSLNWHLDFLICPFLVEFSCPKRDNNTIMMSINCLFSQDRHRSSFIWPCKSWTNARFGFPPFVTKFTHVPRHLGV